MYCNNCGYNLHENRGFCNNCGIKLVADEDEKLESADHEQSTNSYSNTHSQQPYESTASVPVQYTMPPSSPSQHSYGYDNKINNKNKVVFAVIGGVAALAIAIIAIVFFLNRGGDSGVDSFDTKDSDIDIEAVIEEAPPISQEAPDIEEDDEENTLTEPTLLTVEESRFIAQAWLDENPVEEPNLLDADYYEEITHEGNDYYRFFHVEPWMYWFSILVNTETGDLNVMLIEDGMDPIPPVIEPLDDWYDSTYMNVSDVGPHFYNAIMSNASWIEISITWDDRRVTVFTRNPEREWIMTSRDGGTSVVLPEFSLDGSTIEIRFPTTSRVYYLYDDLSGIFGNESLVWEYDVRG